MYTLLSSKGITIVCLLLFLCCSTAFGQKIKKDRSQAIAAIEAVGGHVITSKDNMNFSYLRTDEIGDVLVIYQCQGNTVTTVLFLCNEPTHVPLRALQAFKTMDLGYEVDPNQPKVFKGRNSCYYAGYARYNGVNDYQKNLFYLEVKLLD